VGSNPLWSTDPSGLADDIFGRGRGPSGPITPNPSAEAQRNLAKQLDKLVCPPECAELLADVKRAAEELLQRYNRMLSDPRELYSKAYCEPTFGQRIGTWLGHGDQLEKAIERADAANCPVDPSDRVLLRIQRPNCPLNR
jgi:hypothetical protein